MFGDGLEKLSNNFGVSFESEYSNEHRKKC